IFSLRHKRRKFTRENAYLGIWADPMKLIDLIGQIRRTTSRSVTVEDVETVDYADTDHSSGEEVWVQIKAVLSTQLSRNCDGISIQGFKEKTKQAKVIEKRQVQGLVEDEEEINEIIDEIDLSPSVQPIIIIDMTGPQISRLEEIISIIKECIMRLTLSLSNGSLSLKDFYDPLQKIQSEYVNEFITHNLEAVIIAIITPVWCLETMVEHLKFLTRIFGINFARTLMQLFPNSDQA
ncbi:12826_t:CDS:2, partial [Funneliformis caledonium]